jgi:hypothetical protein
LNEGDVTYEALSGEHWQKTREQAIISSEVTLFIQDGSELNYSNHPAQGWDISAMVAIRGLCCIVV